MNPKDFFAALANGSNDKDFRLVLENFLCLRMGEESNEVGKAAAKLSVYGPATVNPWDPKAVSNWEQLLLELADLYGTFYQLGRVLGKTERELSPAAVFNEKALNLRYRKMVEQFNLSQKLGRIPKTACGFFLTDLPATTGKNRVGDLEYNESNNCYRVTLTNLNVTTTVGNILRADPVLKALKNPVFMTRMANGLLGEYMFGMVDGMAADEFMAINAERAVIRIHSVWLYGNETDLKLQGFVEILPRGKELLADILNNPNAYLNFGMRSVVSDDDATRDVTQIVTWDVVN